MPFPDKIVLEDEASPPSNKDNHLEALQKLVAALEKGGYEAEKCGLVSGQPLIVEDLAPIMKVVTYGDPGVYRDWERRCLRIAKVFRFFRMNNWAHMTEQAAYHFEDRKKYYSITLRKN
jgi:hypothetical protein